MKQQEQKNKAETLIRGLLPELYIENCGEINCKKHSYWDKIHLEHLLLAIERKLETKEIEEPFEMEYICSKLFFYQTYNLSKPFNEQSPELYDLIVELLTNKQ